MRITMGTLKYNDDLGEGEVRFTPTYHHWTRLNKPDGSDYVIPLDMLFDWFYDIRAERDRVHALCYPVLATAERVNIWPARKRP
jgi:hypothetical protein